MTLDAQSRLEGVIFLALFTACIPSANWIIQNVGTTCVPNGPCLIPVAPGLMAPSAVLVVGLAFFQNFILQIDYPNSRLRIITRDAMDLKDAANVRMKKNGSMSQPMVKVELNDEYKAWLMLDTGNSTGIFMPRKPAIRYGWLEEFGTTDVQIRGVNKVSASQSFNLPKMTIGPFTMENVIAMVPAEGNETNVGRESTTRTGSRIKKDYSDGILGYDVLKHFVVTIDYKRALLHLAPPADE